MRREVFFSHAAMLFVSVTFCGMAILAKFALSENNPIVFGLYRDVIATPLMLIFTRLKHGSMRWPGRPKWSKRPSSSGNIQIDTPQDFSTPLTSGTSSGGKSFYGSTVGSSPTPSLARSVPPLNNCWKEWGLFAGVGLFSMFGSQLTYLWGDSLAGPTLATIYLALVPALTAVMAIIVREESPNLMRTGGVVVAVAGVLLVVAPWDKLSGSAEASYVSGNLVLLLCAVLTASCSLLQKPLLRAGYHSSEVTGIAYIFALGGLLVTSLVTFAINRDPSEFALKGGALSWGAMVYAGVVASAMDYNLSSYANQHLDATIISAYSVLQPVLAMLWGYFVEGEYLLWHHIVGMALVVMGLPLVARANQTGGSAKVEELKEPLLGDGMRDQTIPL